MTSPAPITEATIAKAIRAAEKHLRPGMAVEVEIDGVIVRVLHGAGPRPINPADLVAE